MQRSQLYVEVKLENTKKKDHLQLPIYGLHQKQTTSMTLIVQCIVQFNLIDCDYPMNTLVTPKRSRLQFVGPYP